MTFETYLEGAGIEGTEDEKNDAQGAARFAGTHCRGTQSCLNAKKPSEH